MFARRTGWKLEPNRLSLLLERMRASGRDILDLTESNPTRCGLRYNTSEILMALADPASLDYEPSPHGLQSAREAVRAYYGERGVAVDQDALILCVSTSEAYSYIFRLLCDPGDQVLVPAPSYPLFDLLAGLQDVTLVAYALLYDHGWQIDWSSLSAALTGRTRAVILVHPNNPTGSYVKPNERAKLNQICAEHDLALIVDEVFIDYAHSGARAASFADNDQTLTFTLSGLSKISALPQMKVAWLLTTGPSEMVSRALARLEIIADTYLSPNAPVQHSIPELLAQRHSIQKQLCDRIHSNLRELDTQLAAQSVCTRLEVEGGWYAVLRVPATGGDEDLAVELLDQRGTLVHPGHFYDFAAEGYLVVSLITPADIFREGIGRLLRHLVQP
jgi:alanine-synthesizing transaminase